MPEAGERRIARAAGLRYVRSQVRGIRRLRNGHGFSYVDPRGKRITREPEIARIRKLAIPPAYEAVWICPDPRGHLQATGRDARGRKQYRYHPQWREVRDEAKFGRMAAFGKALPRLRRRIAADLKLPGLPRNKVLAAIAALLDTTRLRVGNEEYARDNRSYGLTTLRNRHLKFVRDGRAHLSFRGKSGIEHDIVVDNPRLARIMRHCQQLPGQQLFQYLDDEGKRRGIDSGDVNDYLREAMGDDFTAKDFRTWGATLHAMALMGRVPLPDSQRARKACIMDAIRAVAAELRNTPAVCRKSYINPRVFEAWAEGKLPSMPQRGLRGAPRKAEKLALSFLKAK